MPSIGYDPTRIQQLGMDYGSSNHEQRGCECCPYGYHIDLDFVPFTKRMLSREGDYERLKELKDKWRTERQSMNKLLGVDNIIPKSISVSSTKAPRQFQQWEFRDKYLEREERNFGSSVESVDKISLENGLSEAVTDFEEALLRTRSSSKTLSYKIPDAHKFHTFPRIKATSGKESVGNVTANNIFSTYESTPSTISSIHESRKSEEMFEDRQRDNNNERLAELERQTKVIPELEEKVKLLKADKLHLMSLLEIEKSRYAAMEKNLSSGEDKKERGTTTRDTGVQHIVLKRDVGVTHIMPRTRSIAVGGSSDINTDPSSPSADNLSPSWTLKRRVKMFNASVQVKDYDFPIDDNENRVPVLQIIEGVEFGVQVGPGLAEESQQQKAVDVPPPPPIRRKTTGVMAKPVTRDAGTLNKPTQRDFGCGTIAQPVEPPKQSVKKDQASISHVAVNTDKLRTITIGCNTESEKKVSRTTSASQTELEKLDETSQKSQKNLSTSLPSLTPRSPDECKGISKIPRLATSPVSSPRPAVRKILPTTSSSADRSESPSSSSGSPCPLDYPSVFRKPAFERSDTYTKEVYAPERHYFGNLEPLEEDDREGPRSSSASSSSGGAGVVYPQEKREKISPSKEMQAALKVLNDALLRGKTTQKVTNAISIILHEWFRIAGTKTANPFDVEDYLDSFEIYSPQLLRYIVNMPDGNGNTALHYAVSHGNFDVVSILLDSKVCDPNKANKAGYTSIMLVALANISSDSHRQVVRRLFSLGDVNIKAAQHGQTALMLGASHGRLDTVRLLLEAGADINIQDEDGSTALMCAAEHGHTKLVKYLLAHPDCDPHLTDNDGSTAFSIAMEGQHKDIGVLLYAQMHFSQNESSGGGQRSRSTTPSASSHNSTASSSVQTSPLASKRQIPSPLTRK